MMCSHSCLTAYNWLRRHLGEMVWLPFRLFWPALTIAKRPAHEICCAWSP